jgi:hypothetical protein
MLSRRSLEVAAAALTASFGAAVMASSVDSGIGWSSGGVGPGAFPFITGTIIVLGSLYNLARGALASGPAMLGWTQLKKLGALFLPACAFVAAIPVAGLHVAAVAYVFGTLFLQQRLPLRRSLLVAALTGVALYAIFDWMFQVPLPRGALGEAMGY